MGRTTPSRAGLRIPIPVASRSLLAGLRLGAALLGFGQDRGAPDPSGRRRALKVLDFVSEQAGIVTICTYRTLLGPGSAPSERGSEFHTCVALCPRPRWELAIPISWGETTLRDTLSWPACPPLWRASVTFVPSRSEGVIRRGRVRFLSSVLLSRRHLLPRRATGLTAGGCERARERQCSHRRPIQTPMPARGHEEGGSPRDVSRLICLLYTSPSPRDLSTSRMPSSA